MKIRDLDTAPMKPGDEMSAAPMKPGDEMSAAPMKPGDEMGVSGLVDVRMATLAVRRAKSLLQDLRAVQGRLGGADRAAVERVINSLETELATIDANYGSAVRDAYSRRQGDTTAGRAINVHLHFGA